MIDPAARERLIASLPTPEVSNVVPTWPEDEQEFYRHGDWNSFESRNERLSLMRRTKLADKLIADGWMQVLPEHSRSVEEVLRAHGLTDRPDEYDSSIHSWRCENPDRYGACMCFAELLHGLLMTMLKARVEATSRDAIDVYTRHTQTMRALDDLGIVTTYALDPVDNEPIYVVTLDQLTRFGATSPAPALEDGNPD